MVNSITEQIDKEIASKGKYLKLADGEIRVLQFDPDQVEIVKKDFNNDGKIQTKVEYKVIDPKDKEEKEWTLTMGLKFARLIQARLDKGKSLLEVQRFGTGTKTDYSFTPV